MTKFQFIILGFFAFPAFACAQNLSGLKMTADEARAKNIVAVVDGVPIHWPEMEAMTDELYKELTVHPTGADVDKKLAELRPKALTELINRQVMISNSERTVGTQLDSQVDDHQNETIKLSYHGDPNAFYKALQDHAETIGEYRQKLKDDFAFSYMVGKVSDKAEKYYWDHPEFFPEIDKTNITAIIFFRRGFTEAETKDIDAKAILKTQSVFDQVKAGTSFDAVAKQFFGETKWASLTPKGLPGNGFDYPYGYFNLSDWWPIVERLKPGEISGLITTPDSYLIIRVNGRRAASVTETPELDASEMERYNAFKVKNYTDSMDKLCSQSVIQRFD